MIPSQLPWLDLALLLPLLGSVWVSRLRQADAARHGCLVFSGLTLAALLGAWLQFAQEVGVHSTAFLDRLLGVNLFAVDELNAALLVLTALIYFLTAAATPRTKSRRFSFAGALAGETVVLTTLACHDPWSIISLLALGTLIPYINLRVRKRSTAVYVLHMVLYVALLIIGWGIVEVEGSASEHSWLAMIPLLMAVLIRTGIAPFHCWMTDLFENAAFGLALVFALPMLGIYAAVRLVLPIAPDWILRTLGMFSLISAIYAAGMTLVQRDMRRFFCYLLLSQTSLIMVGMDTIAPVGLTGGLCVWLSASLALLGLGLALRALEARHGRLSLHDFHGLNSYTPMLGTCFLLTGLATVGFPGTFGFLGTELLVDGAVQVYPYVGVAVVAVAALNGIAIVQAYFLLFTGTKPAASSVALAIGSRERFVFLTIASLVILGGLFPQFGIESRHRAATEILSERHDDKEARESEQRRQQHWDGLEVQRDMTNDS